MLTLALALQTLVVDAAGAGDHLTIQGAVAAAAPGDVILVQPGTYAGFAADKALSILGPGAEPAPLIQGDCTIDGAAAFTLAGLEIEGTLTCTDVLGRLELDELRIVGKVFPLDLRRCAQAVLQRSTIDGDRHEYYLWSFDDPPTAVRVEDGALVAVQCELRGGDGTLPGYDYAPGGVALRAINSSVTLAACDLYGGAGGTYATLFTFCEPGGDGLRATQSMVSLRGFDNEVTGGNGGFGCNGGDSAQLDGAILVHSGVGLPAGINEVGGVLPSTILNPPNEPFLTLFGGDEPGETRRLLVHAKSSQIGVVVGGLPATPLALPGVEGLVWTGFGAPFFVQPVTGTGVATPVQFSFALPADLSGLSGSVLGFQAAFPGVPGALDPTSFPVTNPVDAVLRF